MTQDYFNRRRDADLPLQTTCRDAVLIAHTKDIAAQVDPDHLEAVESVVRDAMVECAAIAEYLVGFKHQVTARMDWTHRTFTAKGPRSRGGVFSARFRNTDLEGVTVTDAGPGISLRLGQQRYLAPLDNAHRWREYPVIGDHPLIGDLDGTLRDALRALVQHEYAHAVAEFGLLHGGAPIAYRLRAIGDRWAAAGHYRPFGSQRTKYAAHERSWQALYAAFRNQPRTFEDILATPTKIPVSSICQQCGTPFEAAARRQDGRPHRRALYCGTACKLKASRARKKAAI